MKLFLDDPRHLSLQPATFVFPIIYGDVHNVVNRFPTTEENFFIRRRPIDNPVGMPIYKVQDMEGTMRINRSQAIKLLGSMGIAGKDPIGMLGYLVIEHEGAGLEVRKDHNGKPYILLVKGEEIIAKAAM
jgi:hypothetical protein